MFPGSVGVLVVLMLDQVSSYLLSLRLLTHSSNPRTQTADLSSSARGDVISDDPCRPTGIYLKYLPCL